MRRLPVYFVIDVSDSMIGTALESVKKGLSLCFENLQANPYALETAFISMITFAGRVERPLSMVEAYRCVVPELSVGSGTSFGKALDVLMKDIDENVRPSTPEAKGDWRPIVFLFTDGQPTDNYRAAVDRWKARYMHKANLVVAAIGRSVNLALLREISEDVVQLETADAATFTRFFRWITDSVQTKSEHASNGTEEQLRLSGLDLEGMRLLEQLDANEMRPTEDCVILHAQCSSTQQHYLIKYDRNESGDNYHLTGCYPIDAKRYEALSAKIDTAFSIDADRLEGNVTCPCCGNDIGFLRCGACGSIFCGSSEELYSQCPWCGNRGRIVAGTFSVDRTLG